MHAFRCCSGCSEDQADSDPYSDTKQIIDSVAETHRRLAAEHRNREAADAALQGDDLQTSGPTSSLQRQQRNNPFQGVPLCPSLLFAQGQEARTCEFCREPFGVGRRRHHCRLCGFVFHGGRCSRKERLTANQVEPVTVCSLCYGFYTHYRQTMQRGKRFTEHGRNRSCLHRSVSLAQDCEILHLGQPVHISGRTREPHLRDAASVSEIALLDVAEVSTAYPAGALMGFSDGTEGPVIRVSTTSRSLLLGLESADDQKTWLDGLRAAVHVTKRKAFLAEASGESWRKDNQSLLNRRNKERARRMLGYSLSRDKWREGSPQLGSASNSPQPQRRTVSLSDQPSQHHHRQRQHHQPQQQRGRSSDHLSGSSDTDSVPSVPQNSASNSSCPSPSPQRRGGGGGGTGGRSSGSGGGGGGGGSNTTDLAQAVVEMEMSDPTNGQKQRWTVRATSSMPPPPHQQQQRKDSSSAADGSGATTATTTTTHRRHRRQQSPMQGRDDFTPSPAPRDRHRAGSGRESDDATSTAPSAAAAGRRSNKPRAPPPPVARATPPVAVAEHLDATAHVTKLVHDMPVVVAPLPVTQHGAVQRSARERLSGRFRARRSPSPSSLALQQQQQHPQSPRSPVSSDGGAGAGGRRVTSPLTRHSPPTIVRTAEPPDDGDGGARAMSSPAAEYSCRGATSSSATAAAAAGSRDPVVEEYATEDD